MTTREGLIWSPAWSLPTDSAYGKCCKLASMISIGHGELCERMFGGRGASQVVSKSLLDTGWCMGAAGTIAEEISLAGTQHRWGAWAPNVFRFDRLRYCAACFAEGFHSLYSQLDALALCPAHQCSFLASCGKCGHPTAPLAVGAVTRPFGCLACGAFLGDGRPGATRNWACRSTAQAYAELFPADQRAPSAQCLISGSWNLSDRCSPIHEAERVLNFRVAVEFGQWDVDTRVFDPALGAIVSRRIDPWRQGGEIPARPDWEDERDRLKIDRYPALRKAYIRNLYALWRDRILALAPNRSVESAFDRDRTHAGELGKVAAVERLDEYIGHLLKGDKGSAHQSQQARVLEELLDPLGWSALFGFVVDEEMRKAGRWKAAFRCAQAGSEECGRLVAVYGSPYVPGPLGVCVWGEGKQVMAFIVGNAFGDRLDWYGFTGAPRTNGVSAAGLVDQWRRGESNSIWKATMTERDAKNTSGDAPGELASE